MIELSLDQEVAQLFPQLKRQVRGRRMVYLDSAATALKPLSVIEAVKQSLTLDTANVHRGAHFLSDAATDNFEKVREGARSFLNAASVHEIIFTRGTTDGINLVAQTWGRSVLQPGDEIILSQMEHHSNIVPWQMIAAEKGAIIRFIPVQDNGGLDIDAYKSMLSPRVKMVSLVHLSNALGTINPVAQIFALARAVGSLCLLDAAQSVAVLPLDVEALGCDFLVFSGHKVFGPTGIGVLYGAQRQLDQMPPYQGGGSMISEVRETGSDYLAPPHRFEAGTPPIAEVMGLGAALEFLKGLGYARIREHEQALRSRAEAQIDLIPGMRRIGNTPDRGNVISFLLGDAHPSDVGAILDEQGIAVRAGHHCCQPLMRRFKIPGTTRASLSIYTNESDIEDFVSGLKKAKELLL